ncbi:CHASE2 domain-containing protein [Thermodesulfobacteriota bacterium]
MKTNLSTRIATVFLLFAIMIAGCATGLKGIFDDDVIHKRKHTTPGDPGRTEIVIIDITDRDIKNYGRWPWGRDIQGKAVTVLNQYKAKGVYFDIFFTEADDRWPAKDKAFRDAIDISDIPVFIPFVFVAPGGGRTALLYPVQTLDVVENADVVDIKRDILLSLPEFVHPSSGTGFINYFPDKRGVLREIRAVLKWRGSCYPFMGVTIAAYYFGVPVDKIVLKGNVMDFGSKKLVLTKSLGIRPEFGQPFTQFKHYSYTELFEADLESALKGRFVIMASNATGLTNLHVTPTSNRYPGSEVHAVILDYLLNDLQEK